MQKITLTSTGSANRFLELLRSHEVAKIATEVAKVALARRSLGRLLGKDLSFRRRLSPVVLYFLLFPTALLGGGQGP